MIEQIPFLRLVDYRLGQVCSVSECTNLAEYEVYLHKIYPEEASWPAREYFRQDFTCPYICGPHMDENEARAKGPRSADGETYYPFTNRHFRRGYTKYRPLAEVFDVLAESRLVVPGLIEVYSEVNDELLAYLASHPVGVHELSPRRFEEVVATIFRRRGFQVQVTPATRDGGRDLIAVHHDDFGPSIYLVECKRYAASRRVGVETVRGLYGVVEAERATRGVLVTTSSFTRVALDFASPLRFRLSLHDFDTLRSWLKTVSPGAA